MKLVNTILLTSLLILSTFSANAQTDNITKGEYSLTKSYIALSCGKSIPLAQYAASYCTPGMGYSIEAAYFFSKYIGLGVHVDYNNHGLDEDKVYKMNECMIHDDAQFTMDVTGTNRTISAQAGLFATVNITSWLQITGKAMFGPQYYIAPEYSFHIYRQFQFNGQTLADNWHETSHDTYNWEYGFIIGGAANIMVARNLSLFFNYTFAESYHDYHYFRETEGVLYDNEGHPFYGTGKQIYTYEIQLEYAMMTIGISYHFN